MIVNWRTPNAELALPAALEHTHEWHTLRQQGYTGTDAAALLGVNHYSTPADVYEAKTAGAPDEGENSGILEFGHRMEPILADLFEDETNLDTRNIGTLKAKNNPAMLANPDRITSDGGVLEIKTTAHNGDTAAQWRANEVPGHAYVQLQHYLAVTGRSHGWFMVGFRNSFINYDEVTSRDWRNTWFVSYALRDTKLVGPVEADEAVQADIVQKIDAMQKAVAAGDPGLIEWPESIDPDRRWPTTTPDTTTVARFGTDSFVRRYQQLTAEKKKIEAEIAKIQRNLKTQLAGTETLTMDDGTVLATYKTATRNSFSQSEFRKDHPDLWESYKKPSASRRLTVKNLDA